LELKLLKSYGNFGSLPLQRRRRGAYKNHNQAKLPKGFAAKSNMPEK